MGLDLGERERRGRGGELDDEEGGGSWCDAEAAEGFCDLWCAVSWLLVEFGLVTDCGE